MPKVTVPGVIYSLLLAVGAWALDYLSVGAGSGIPVAPILIAAIPIVLKMFTATTEPTPPAAQARAMGAPEKPGYWQRVLLG